MNEGQEKFYHFILERVREDKLEAAEVLLKESFAKQDTGTFGADYLRTFVPEMLSYLKPEYVEEVKSIMMKYRVPH